MTHRRPNRWNLTLLNRLSEASGKNHNTIRNSVQHLAHALKIPLSQITMPDPPTPYCLFHKINVTSGFMERKGCIRKNCPYLTYVKQIVKFQP